MSKKSYIKEMEQNVLNQAKFWTDYIEMIDSMQSGMFSFSERGHTPIGIEKIQQGLSQMRQGAYDQLQHALARCFCVVGVGGKDAEAFSRERAKQVFDGKYSVMHWLDNHAVIPSSWMVQDEKDFRAELDEALK